jgi:signal peptidase I
MTTTFSKQVFLFIAASSVALFLCFSIFRVYQVKSDSMEPFLYSGQTILIIKGKSPRSGDVVVFENPEDKKLVVKRCILSPGDPIIINNGSLIIDRKKIPLTTKQLRSLSSMKFIPENMFFAAGDNIFNSHDSRDYGPVLTANLKGRVLLIK